MIHLTLLHPIKNTPIQHWTFKHETVVRIGRGTDNQVILYSAVVSRHHAELRYDGSAWEIVNLGTNGTYLDGKRITQVPAADGIVLRLARSGPKIQIRFGDGSLPSVSGVGNVPISAGLPGLPPDVVEAGSTEKTVPGLHPPTEGLQSLKSPAQQTTMEREQPILRDQPSEHFFPITDPDLAAMPQRVVAAPGSTLQAVTSEQSSLATDCQDVPEKANVRFDLTTGKPLQILQQIGDYQLMDIIGQGRVAITYLAWRNGQTLALKTVNSDWLGDPAATAMFEHEARVLRVLNHSNLPRFIDFFAIAGQPYLVMEMIYGQTLTNYVTTHGKVSPRQAIAWMLEICNTLEYLHSLNPPILHRNLRPNNLIRRTYPQGNHEIVVMDVGAARVVGLEADTQVELESYSAPEQQDGNATPASDLYSLGPILVYLLTGQLPNRFYKFTGDEFRLSVDMIPDLHPEMGQLLTKLTHPKPTHRYTNAQELASSLSQIHDQLSNVHYSS